MKGDFSFDWRVSHEIWTERRTGGAVPRRWFFDRPRSASRRAYQPFVDELVAKIDEVVGEAVDEGLLDPGDTFPDASFETRLALVSNACSEPEKIWKNFQGKRFKTSGMFALRTHPAILDATESLIGPEIYAHPQSNLRAKLPDLEATVVPWHQDLAYLIPEDAGETLFVNFWIPLVKATAENGCLQVLRGSHQVGLLPHDYRTPHFKGGLRERSSGF